MANIGREDGGPQERYCVNLRGSDSVLRQAPPAGCTYRMYIREGEGLEA